MNDGEILIKADFNERQTRALSSAINFTLEKWSGQEPLDQEALFALKTAFHGMILEFNLSKDIS